jgi:hypothetical protein
VRFILGLLQTLAYAESVIRLRYTDETEISRRVRVRMQRQHEILQGKTPRALTYSLRLAPADQDPGCGLNADDNELVPAIRDLSEPVVDLWQAIADGATELAAVARFADLLWCRRQGNPGVYAAQAATTYLALAGAGDVDVSGVRYLIAPGLWPAKSPTSTSTSRFGPSSPRLPTT